FFEHLHSLFDYLPEQALVLRSGDLDAAGLRFWNDIKSRYEDRRHDRQRPILEPSELFLSPDEAFARLRDYPSVELSAEVRSRANSTNVAAPPTLSSEDQQQPLQPLKALMERERQARVLLCAETAGRRESLLE